MANTPNPKLKEHAGQFKEKASALGHNVQELGRISKDIAQDTMGVIRENAGEYYQQGMEKAKNMEQNLEGKIKSHPLQSLLIALGLGFLVGILLRRR